MSLIRSVGATKLQYFFIIYRTRLYYKSINFRVQDYIQSYFIILSMIKLFLKSNKMVKYNYIVASSHCYDVKVEQSNLNNGKKIIL